MHFPYEHQPVPARRSEPIAKADNGRQIADGIEASQRDAA
jgi:hypothetical protein